MILISCSEKNGQPDIDVYNETVTEISVAYNLPVSADGISMTDNDTDSQDDDLITELPGDDVTPIINNDFPDDAILYFAQLAPNAAPDFSSKTPSYPYIYKYNYTKDPEADWDYGYNFKVGNDEIPIEWKTVKQVGSVGNGFKFFAFYFPGNEVNFSVFTDQSTEENLSKSDIMGAYHVTSSLYSRLRFNLFHLMVHLRVTLYVPVLKEETAGSDNAYSGFKKNSLQGAYLRNAQTGINIEWYTDRSSDTEAPMTQPTNTSSSIKMYEYDRNGKQHPLTDITRFYPDAKYDKDDVRVYNFSVIFPSQTFGDNFMYFVLKDIDGNYRYFYFSGSQISGLGEYGLTQGTLQQLYLYLPRFSNETLLVKANVLPWTDAVTDMTVSKQSVTSDGEDDND